MHPRVAHGAAQSARLAALWMVGPLLLALGAPTRQLIPAPPCTGGVDLIAIVAARQWPDAAIGDIASWMFIAAAVAALGCFAQFVDRATGSTPVAVAVTLAVGVTMLVPGANGLPWTLAAFGSCALAALAIRSFEKHERQTRRSTAALATLLMAASVVPAWTFGCTVAGLAIIWRTHTSTTKRVVASTVATIVLWVVPLSILGATQMAGLVRSIRWSACVWSTNADAGRLAAVSGLGDLAGPITLALAALGAWTAMAGIGREPAIGSCVVLALAIAPGLGGGWPPSVILAPVLLAIWACAAFGLRETVRAFGSAPRQAVGMALVVFLLPFLQWTMVRAQPNDSIGVPEDHGRASLRQMRSVLNLLAPGSRLVEEDALVETLLRAVRFGRRPAKALVVVSRDRVAVLEALRSSAVYAFPAGQRELTLRGFVVEPVEGRAYPGGRLRGVGLVTGSRACAELQRAWVDLPGVAASGRVALSARSEGAEGPVIVYFSGTTGYLPGPDHWSDQAKRGFHVRMFGRGTVEESARLDAEAAENGLRGHAVFNAPFVARLTVYRTPHAPLTLPIALGPPRSHGVGRLAADYPGALPLTICDAPNAAISGF